MLYFTAKKSLIIIPLDHNPEKASKTVWILQLFPGLNLAII